jgi:hypothetical protein
MDMLELLDWMDDSDIVEKFDDVDSSGSRFQTYVMERDGKLWKVLLVDETPVPWSITEGGEYDYAPLQIERVSQSDLLKYGADHQCHTPEPVY